MNENRREKMDRITQMLTEGVEQVFSSDRYAEWLKIASRFHHYSLNNQILILMQAPHASQVAGYRAWQMMGRQVRKGEKGLLIIAPMKIKDKNPDTEDEERLLFKATTVFDISQTDGDNLPSLVNELTGNDSSYDSLIEKLIMYSPVPVRFKAIPDSAYGYFSPTDREICIKTGLSKQQTCKTLIHEIAHSICDADPKAMTDRETKEVRAESVAYCVCSALGIDTGDYSFGYIAGWSSNKEVPELKNIMQDIKRVADDILTAVIAA